MIDIAIKVKKKDIMSFKDDAEKLIHQYSSSDDPINVAGHICADLIYEYKYISPNKRERVIRHI